MFDSTQDPKHLGSYLEPGTAFIDGAGDEAPYDVVVIGGGQAGLSVGYHLKQRGVRFVILDASQRVGDAWRKRWDSLKLFSPAWLDSLDGLPMPLPRDAFPTKDQMADYLESYARHFALPVKLDSRVQRLHRQDDRFVIETNRGVLRASRVVVAMGGFQTKRVPELASQLSTDITQLHSSEYRNPSQLKPGTVLVVGCGNSGAEIARDLAGTHRVVMTASKTDEVPFDGDSLFGKWVANRLLMRVVFHRVLTIDTPLGRKAQPTMKKKVTPLIRTRSRDLERAGVERAGKRITGVEAGRPLTDEGHALDVQNVIWCTGYHVGQSWLDVPIFDADGFPRHQAGVAIEAKGLYFVGLPFLYSMSSAMVHGVGRDAARICDIIAKELAARTPQRALAALPSPARG